MVVGIRVMRGLTEPEMQSHAMVLECQIQGAAGLFVLGVDNATGIGNTVDCKESPRSERNE